MKVLFYLNNIDSKDFYYIVTKKNYININAAEKFWVVFLKKLILLFTGECNKRKNNLKMQK